MNVVVGGDAGPTDDVFLAGCANGPLRILQPRHGLRSGLDAVMLAAAASVSGDQTVLDAGAGVGVVGLAVARRCAGARVTLVERQAELAALARENVARNGMSDRVRVIGADLLEPLSALAALGLEPQGFDHVLANPPFHADGTVRMSPHALKSGASAFARGDLERWLRFLAAMARPGGRLTLIHRADALRDVLDAIGQRFGALCIFPLFARQGEAATRILVQGIKGNRAPLAMLPGLVLHAPDGGYTAEAERILRNGDRLSLAAD